MIHDDGSQEPETTTWRGDPTIDCALALLQFVDCPMALFGPEGVIAENSAFGVFCATLISQDGPAPPLGLIAEQDRERFSAELAAFLAADLPVFAFQTNAPDDDGANREPALRLMRIGAPGHYALLVRTQHTADSAPGESIQLVRLKSLLHKKNRILADTTDQLRRFQALADHSRSAMLITDADGVIGYVNPRFSEVTGYSESDAIGAKPSILKSGKTPPAVYHDLWTTILSGRPWRGGLLNRRKTGDCYWTDAEIVPLRDQHGRITHFAANIDDVSEARQVATSLKDQQTNYENLVATSQNLIWVTDADHRLTFLNPAWQLSHGRPLREMLGRRLCEFRAPSDRDEMAPFWEALRSKRVGSTETAHLDARGDMIQLVLRAVGRFGEDGVYLGAQGTAVDVTDLVRSLRAVEGSEARLQAVIRAIPDRLYVIDERSDLSSLSRATGGERSGLAAEGNLAAHFAPPVAERILGLVRDSQRAQEVSAFTYRIDDDDGERWCEARVVPIASVTGDRALCICRNVTETVRAERQARLLAAALEQTPDAIEIIDLHGRIQYANTAFERMTGHSAAEIVGELAGTVHEAMPPLDQIIAHCDTTAPTRSTMLSTRCADGRCERRAAFLNPVRDLQARIFAILVVHSAAAGEGAAGAGGAGQPAREPSAPTIDLSRLRDQEFDAQLLQRSRLAVIGEMAASMAHEIRNPLVGIVSAVDFICEDIENAPQEVGSVVLPWLRYLSTISTAANRCVEYIGRMLQFGGHSRAEAELVDVNHCIDRAVSLVGPKLHDAGLRLQLRTVPDVTVRGNAVDLQHVLINLLLNAAQATPRGGRVAISLGEGNGLVTLSVSDTGRGIPADQQDQVFEPFFTTRRDTDGVGLGLTICRRTIIGHGGRIAVESREGEGTTFLITLPAAVAFEKSVL